MTKLSFEQGLFPRFTLLSVTTVSFFFFCCGERKGGVKGDEEGEGAVEKERSKEENDEGKILILLEC